MRSVIGFTKHNLRQEFGCKHFVWGMIQEAQRGSGVIRQEGRKPTKGVLMGVAGTWGSTSWRWAPQTYPAEMGLQGHSLPLAGALHMRPVTGDLGKEGAKGYGRKPTLSVPHCYYYRYGYKVNFILNFL